LPRCCIFVRLRVVSDSVILGDFADDPSLAGDSLMEQLEFAKTKVPEKERSRTRVYLMATAGLRRLDKKIQEAVLESCRNVLHASSFQFRDEWASVISGTFFHIRFHCLVACVQRGARDAKNLDLYVHAANLLTTLCSFHVHSGM
jgi:hypothetical protein